MPTKMNCVKERSTKPTVARSSRAGRAFCCPVTPPKGETMEQRRRIASPIDWIVAPDWLTVEEACFLATARLHCRDGCPRNTKTRYITSRVFYPSCTSSRDNIKTS